MSVTAKIHGGTPQLRLKTFASMRGTDPQRCVSQRRHPSVNGDDENGAPDARKEAAGINQRLEAIGESELLHGVQRSRSGTATHIQLQLRLALQFVVERPLHFAVFGKRGRRIEFVGRGA